MESLRKGIRRNSSKEFNNFIDILEKLQYLMIEKIPIIVTTCKAAKSNVFKDMHFSKVIIDEATQSHELETLETFLNADQVVLVGD